MKILDVENIWQDIDYVVKQLRKGAIIIYPTETVAGIGCIGTNKKVMKRLFEIKERETNKVVSYAFSSLEMAQKYVKFSKLALKLSKLFPGPLTMVLPIKNDIELFGVFDTIGVRIPNIPWLLELIERLNEPLVTTSANISSNPSISHFDELDEKLKKRVDIVIKWIGYLGEAPSTVISVENGIQILRLGAISEDSINSTLR